MATLDLEIRVGLHSGEVQLLGDEPTGMAMHIAARVCALADAGQVLITDAARRLLDEAVVATTSIGSHRLKGVPDEHALYAATPAVRPDLPRPRKELTLQDRMVGQAVRRAPGMSRALIRLSRSAS
jgi:class 3 adenylate cyclase